MSNPQNDEWSWFRELLAPLRPSSHEGRHPSRAVLYAYVKGRLHDSWRADVRSSDPPDWTLTKVSQHALVCRGCAHQLALLRRLELEHVAPWRDLWQRFPRAIRAIRAHSAVYALALVALFALNVLFVTVLPAPMVLRPCVPAGDEAGLGKPIDAQAGNLRIEGLNRPVKLPSLLSGECAPVPAPRPWWQTWWIGWVFLVWTMLLGLHILWDWLVNPPPQVSAPVTTRSFV